MSQTVAAVYATRVDAEVVRQALIVEGFESSAISITSLESDTHVVQSAHEGGIRGFFRSLFGLEPEHPEVERYASAVDLGRAVVTAEVDDEQALTAKAILARHAPLDLQPGEGYVTDTDRLRNGDAEPQYRTTMPFGESISAGAAGAADLPGPRPGTGPVPDSETESRLAQAPVTPDPYARAPVTPASIHEDPLLNVDPSRTQPFTPVAAPMLPPLPEATPHAHPTDLYAARDASLDAAAAVRSGRPLASEPVLAPDALGEGISHAPGLEPSPPVDPASVVGASEADDPHATHKPHEVPPLAPIVPPVAPIAPPAGRDTPRRRQR